MSDSTDPGGSAGGFDDPTAPAWASPEPAAPTEPIATEPPVAPPSPYPPQPYDPAAPGQDHSQSPYAPSPYGSPFPARTPYGQQPYGSTAYGQPPYSMPPAPYGAPPAKNTSAIVLTVISAVTLLACCNLLAIPSLVLGIVGLNKAGTDPQGSARATRAGWITFGVTAALVVVGWVVFFALAASGSLDGSIQSDYEGL